MAIRHREGRANPWQVYWNNPYTGKRECMSFATKEEAEKEDSLVKHRLKFERESFKNDKEEETESAGEITLEQVYFLYLREKQFTRKSLSWQLGSMKHVLFRMGERAINSITYDDLRRVMTELYAMPVKSVTSHGRMAVFRTVMRWALEKGFLDALRFPKLLFGAYEKFVPPTPEELRAMLAVAEPHIKRVIILGAQCGLRVGPSEMFRLTWDDVDIEAGLVRAKGARKNPNAPWREIPIRKSLIPVFTEWRNADLTAGVHYVVHYGGKPIESIKNAWATTLKRAGVIRRIRPYDLRHAFATELLANGVDIGTAAKLMGHSSPAMIYKRYQYVLDKQKIGAIESLPDLSHVPKNMCPKEKVVRLYV